MITNYWENQTYDQIYLIRDECNFISHIKIKKKSMALHSILSIQQACDV